MKVEVLGITPAARPYILAHASVRVSFVTHVGNEYTFVVNSIDILPDAAGSVRVKFPRYKIGPGRGAPVVITSPVIQRAVEDAVAAAFEQWQAERAKLAAENAAQQQNAGGAR